MIISELGKNVLVHRCQASGLNRHKVSHKPIGKAANPTLNRLANLKATESTVLPKGAEQ